MDLELAATDELIDELQKRFDHSVFCGVKEKHGCNDYVQRSWCGDKLKCVGLAQWVADFVLKAFSEVGYDVADDEGTETDD